MIRIQIISSTSNYNYHRLNFYLAIFHSCILLYFPFIFFLFFPVSLGELALMSRHKMELSRRCLESREIGANLDNVLESRLWLIRDMKNKNKRITHSLPLGVAAAVVIAAAAAAAAEIHFSIRRCSVEESVNLRARELHRTTERKRKIKIFYTVAWLSHVTRLQNRFVAFTYNTSFFPFVCEIILVP